MASAVPVTEVLEVAARTAGLPARTVSAVEVKDRCDGTRAPSDAAGTLGATWGPGSAPPAAGTAGAGNASPQDAGVVGTGLASLDPHAVCPSGSDGVPGTLSAGVAPPAQAAAGPESRHC